MTMRMKHERPLGCANTKKVCREGLSKMFHLLHFA